MAHAEGNITIDRPVKEVFDFILDGTNSPLWRPSVVDVQLMPGKPLGVGTVFKQGLKGPGGRIDGDYEIIECKPNELIKFQVIAGPARPAGTYIFQSMDNSTQVTFILDFQPKGLAKLMDGMINNSMKGEVATLSNLKAYLETHK
ncbi:MAG TPA: SRPBCC family protein [Anaerolineales bacterium]